MFLRSFKVVHLPSLFLFQDAFSMNQSVFFSRIVKISLFNLFLVACFGVAMRYKIAFALPFLDQKNILHAHSHFAFSGWVSNVLMLLLINYLIKAGENVKTGKYRWLIYANLTTAYGMLFSLGLFGYNFLSICFSTASIFVSYAFAFVYWRDMSKIKPTGIEKWIKAALIFSVLSSIGPFTLAFMLATKNLHQHLYLSSVYYFLHFQYNGWFLFSCIGLALNQFFPNISKGTSNLIFWLFAGSFFPTYFLSVLWMPLPTWVYVIIVVAAFAQFAGWLALIRDAVQKRILDKLKVPELLRLLLFCAALAMTIKLILQLGSTIPQLSKLAYGFRPVIIGYLHLILLGVITISLFSFMIAQKMIMISKTTRAGIIIFVSGAIINELLLLIQGISDISYYPVPHINTMLLIAACILLTGALTLFIGRKNSDMTTVID
jgi:hypothetical protein